MFSRRSNRFRKYSPIVVVGGNNPNNSFLRLLPVPCSTVNKTNRVEVINGRARQHIRIATIEIITITETTAF